MKTKVNIVNAHELDPNKKYLVIFSRQQITENDASELLKALSDIDIMSIGVAVEDASGIKIIEAQK